MSLLWDSGEWPEKFAGVSPEVRQKSPEVRRKFAGKTSNYYKVKNSKL